jgi:hypothetical protein
VLKIFESANLACAQLLDHANDAQCVSINRLDSTGGIWARACPFPVPEVVAEMNKKRSLLIAMVGLLLTVGAGSALAQNPNCPRGNCPNPGQTCPNPQCPRGANAGKRGPAAMNRGARRGARMAAKCPRLAATTNATVQPPEEKKQ